MPAATSKDRLYLLDTTLRDGAQAHGVDFRVEDRWRIAAALDDLGIDYIEGGYPGARGTDTAFFATAPTFRSARLTAFGMSRRARCAAGKDPAFQAVLEAPSGAVCLLAKAWDHHVRVALGMTHEENVRSVVESVKAARAAGKEVMIDCEHFFDGYKNHRAHALAVAEAAYESGARWVVLCDTNGGALPGEIGEIVRDVARRVPGTHLGIHAHDDTDHAVANTLEAVRAGCRQIQGAFGLGGRSGNADLASIIPTLMLTPEFADRFETGVMPGRLHTLAHVARVLDATLAASVGQRVSAGPARTDGGVALTAIDALQVWGRSVTARLSRHRQHLDALTELERLGIDLDKSRAGRVLEALKMRQTLGYAYDGADASLELLARRVLGDVPKYFSVDNFRVVDKQHRAPDGTVTRSEAAVQVHIQGDSAPLWSVAEGKGPVEALDKALRGDLGRYQPHIAAVALADYKVRLLRRSGEAVTRVTVEYTDRSTGESWFTVGVSSNIIDASFEALIEALNYRLLKSDVAAARALAS